MGRRGRKQEPTALKLARGTHRRDRHGSPELEPQPSAIDKLPPAPRILGAAGQAAWLQDGEQAFQMGTLTAADLSAFETYCRELDELAACDRQLEKDGCWVATKGSVIRHPALLDKRELRRSIAKHRETFGLTPTGRAGRQIVKDQQTVMSRTRG